MFFDEIGDTSLLLQAKLLRVLESRSLYRLGSTLRRDLDIRVLAATNQDLEAATKEQRFRSDLYYRLNVIRIEIPPLRERSEDIPSLVGHYVRRLNAAFDKRVVALSSHALEQLMVYPWPGNVRELRNVLEATFVHLDAHAGGTIDLPRQVATLLRRSTNREVSERLEVLRALAATKWNKNEAAKALHWSRMTLYRKMVRYRISSPRMMTD
jgi:two-component system response regulator HydG/two-component system response regulator AtoC